MAVLERQEFLHRRGKDNQVLPETVELEDGSGEVVMTPLKKGELNEIAAKGKKGQKETDFEVQNKDNAEIIYKHLVEPKFSVEELMSEEFKALKFAQLSTALLRVSGYNKKKA